MALATYSDLLSAIARWATRTGDTDFEASCPEFVRLAEVRLNGDLRVSQMEASAVVVLVDGAVVLPDDYAGARVFQSGTYPYEPLDFTTPGQGVYFADGSADPTTSTMMYYAKIPPLSVGSPTNWLLRDYPNLYLYASLLEAAPFMEEDARAVTWKSYYDAALQAAKRDDTRVRYPYGCAQVSQDTP